MDEYLDSARVAEILAAEYGDQGFVILEEGGEEHIVVRCRRQGGQTGTWGYYGTIGEADTMWRLERLAAP